MKSLPNTAIVKIQRNNLSNTIATYFQSSFTLKRIQILNLFGQNKIDNLHSFLRNILNYLFFRECPVRVNQCDI